MSRALWIRWLLLVLLAPACADLGGGAPTDGNTTGQGGDVVVIDSVSPAEDTAAAVDTAPPVDTTPPPEKSCDGKCGAKYDPSLPCQCNDQCGKFGNCCVDYGPLCEPQKFTCVGRCGAYDKSAPCQCDDGCARYGTCCPDYLAKCHEDASFDFIEPDPEEAKLCDKPASLANIQYAKDGDTLELIDGSVVRLLLVNTPELTTQDCYAKNALNWMKSTVKKYKTVCLVSDPLQPDKDQFDRLLRYIYYKDVAAGGKWVNLNLRLIRLGYGLVFYPFAKGLRWEKVGLLSQERARVDKQGGWSACGWK